MMHTRVSNLVLVILALFSPVIPVTRGAEYQVTVGGIGIIKYGPEFVVRITHSANYNHPAHSIIATRRRILEMYYVTFIFKQKNHTVTQSSLDAPCTSLQGGFDSGL